MLKNKSKITIKKKISRVKNVSTRFAKQIAPASSRHSNKVFVKQTSKKNKKGGFSLKSSLRNLAQRAKNQFLGKSKTVESKSAHTNGGKPKLIQSRVLKAKMIKSKVGKSTKKMLKNNPKLKVIKPERSKKTGSSQKSQKSKLVASKGHTKHLVGQKTSVVPAVEQNTQPLPYQPIHNPVLLEEVCELFELPGKKVIVDCTLGLGGHAEKILKQAGKNVKYIGFDVDEDNLQSARKRLKDFGDQVAFIHNNFSALAEELKKLKIKGIDALLLDLGLSSPQVDMAEKGFSFLREGPLDMRFDKRQLLTAADVINKYPEKELARIFYEYGEEVKSRKIAHEIAIRRKSRSFKTTTELAKFIEKLIRREGHIHPATRVFQALRIEVNKELEVLNSVLQQAVELLKKNGRLAVIAYHSLEDRLVKNFFKANARDFINIPDQLTTTILNPSLKIITKKPLVPSSDEMAKNPRSRSAKLRVAQKI